MKDYKKYKKHLSAYIKENIRKGYSIQAIGKALLIYGYERDLVGKLIRNHKLKNIITKSVPLALLLLLIPLFFYIKSHLVGYVVKETGFNFTDNIGLVVNESYEYIWDLENKGQLKSVGLNGKVAANGFVKVYLEYGNSTYLVFDNKELGKRSLEKVTAFAAKEDKEKKEKDKKEKNESEEIPINETPTLNETINETALINETIPIVNETINITQTLNETINITIPINETPTLNETTNITQPTNKSIAIKLQYNENTPYDEDNDGIENIYGVIDFTVENTGFNWDYNEGNLCTRWEVYSVEDNESTVVCHGSGKCCGFFGLAPARENWNEIFYLTYGQYGAAFSNIIGSQVLYIDYNLSIEEPFAEIYYSGWQNLTADFHEEFVRFKNACIETCILPNLNATSYRLVFEIGNSSLILDSISYAISGYEKANNPPMLLKNFSDISIFSGQSYALNLSEYFYDEDNDTLTFSFYNNSMIDVAVANETAALTPIGGFTGAGYMFFTANDSVDAAVSNVFKVDVKERMSFGSGLKSLRRIIGLI